MSKNKVVENKTESVFEKEIREIIKTCIEKEYPKIVERDIKEIIDKLLPDIDRLISNKVKIHMTELFKVGIKKFEK